MLPANPTPEHRSSATSSRADVKSPRVLACVRCQQRKVKCDKRQFPCINCVKANAHCVPAAVAPRQRRRRFAERELLDRLAQYESLLRLHNIEFEPLHGPLAERASPITDTIRHDSPEESFSGPAARPDGRPSEGETTVKSETLYETKSVWRAMNQMSQHSEDHEDSDSSPDSDGVRESVVRKALAPLFQSNDQLLLLGPRKVNADLSTFHPQQVQIFRLWQIYLDSVNSLLKVTHAPTLQSRILDAAGDVANISSSMQALMFGIYCVAVSSLSEEECLTSFGFSKEDLLTGYRFGCQQALLECEVLRTDDRDCLTALFLYLVSVRSDTSPASLSSMLGSVIRIAQREGYHNEAAHAKCSVFEAEMRRRLWWSLVIFDTRISEMSGHKAVVLTPAWDCRPPLNVNDSDLRPEMKTTPAARTESTEMVFAVLRSEVNDFVRRSPFWLDFTNPALKSVAKDTQQTSPGSNGDVNAFGKIMEDKYLKSCNPDNPLDFMAIWSTRGLLAKQGLLEHFSRYSSGPQTQTQRDAGFFHGMRMLECDTKLMTSPMTKKYFWLVQFFLFPFLAYIHLVQELKRQPAIEHAERAWEAMNENYEARFMGWPKSPFKKICSKFVMQAWAAREAMLSQSGKSEAPPQMVKDMKAYVIKMAPNTQDSPMDHSSSATDTNSDDFPMPITMDFSGQGFLQGMGGQGYLSMGPMFFDDISKPSTTQVDVNQFNWGAMDWNQTRGRSF